MDWSKKRSGSLIDFRMRNKEEKATADGEVRRRILLHIQSAQMNWNF